MNVAYCIAEQTAQSDTESIRRVPQTDADWLLFSGVPHGSDEHEAWIRASLRGSSQGTEDTKRSEAVSSCLQHQEEPPHKDVEAQILPNRQSLHEEICRERPGKKAKVKE